MTTTYVRELSIKGFAMWHEWDVLHLKLGLTLLNIKGLVKLGAYDAPYLSKIIFKTLHYLALNTRPSKENLHYMTLNTRPHNAL